MSFTFSSVHSFRTLSTILLSLVLVQSSAAEGMANDMDMGSDVGMDMDDHDHEHDMAGDSRSFCMGSGSTMNHAGFGVSLNNPDRACVTLLFEDWVLDTEAKFICALIGVFVFAMFSEFVGYLHMRIHNTLDEKSLLKPYVLSTLYILQALIGFMLMLITMTFNVELLLAIVFGLGAGYLVSILVVGGTMSKVKQKAQRGRGVLPPVLYFSVILSELISLLPCCNKSSKYHH